MDIESHFELISHQIRNERRERQMTLGEFILKMELIRAQYGDTTIVEGISSELDSYRGYYEDLAFVPDRKGVNVVDLLNSAVSAMGETFQGHKGGDFTMSKVTPLWVAEYGITGEALVDVIRVDGDRIVAVTKDEDEWEND